MSLKKLDIFTLRNINKATIEPSLAINLITGENGSGKSSLLEAIFILGRARSFRATHIKQVIQFEKQQLIVSGQIIQKSNNLVHLGVKLEREKSDIRINQSNSHKAELAYTLPILLIHPKSYKLIDAGPQLRREFLDWGVFNMDENFLKYWRKYKKILQQRNSLLKSKQVDQLHVWDTELTEYGTIVSNYRKTYLDLLQPLFLELSVFFLDLKNIKIQYVSGWNDAYSFAHSIQTDLAKDLKYGFSHSGPHRGDFSILVDGRLAKDYVSRGQLKLLMISLKLAQVKLINIQKESSVSLLIDDLTAELDLLNKAKLLDYLSALNCQVFMSTTELSNFGDLSMLNDYKVFHVEHGNIVSV
ncbi:MAG: DNA replication/repair protein RecF [Methylococcales symbiont of Iophon sp. n. MRB-2018]|nr:MAG: DNA replication/repair protein RecF [Methylococcales symbiont of Iophon sp. n. MRB-2018]KAF3979693.1 MAG: DNA replication/repair protein RecF [Methylococcales symbiont of Iophon sp. n. MRB-2018]